MVLVVLMVVAVVGVYVVLSPSPSTVTTSSGAIYQVVAQNMTLKGQAASVPCEGLNLGSCPSNSTLTGVALIRYGGAYYYLRSLVEPSGVPANSSGVTPTAVYTLWFTNSSLYCVSPAHPLTNALRQTPTCPTVAYHPVTITIAKGSTSVENSTLGLRLGLTLGSNPDGSVNVSVSDSNTLGTVNNLTAASRWPLPPVEMFLWAGGQTCGIPVDLPAGYAIFQGNYTLADIGGRSPLTTYAYPLIDCAYEAPTPFYAFGPHSDVASARPYGNIPSLAKVYNVTVDTACPWTPEDGCIWSLIGPQAGYWTGSGTQAGAGFGVDGGNCPAGQGTNSQPTLDCPLTFNPFPPGVYTVLAGDEWGQAVVLHFTVQW